MEMLVATWTVRLTLLGMLIVGFLSWSAGVTMLEMVLKVAATALALLFAGRQVLGLLESPEQKMVRTLRKGKAAGSKSARKAADR